MLDGIIVAALGVALAMAEVNPGCGGDADTENGAADIEVADRAEPDLVALEPVALHLQDADPVILTHGARCTVTTRSWDIWQHRKIHWYSITEDHRTPPQSEL